MKKTSFFERLQFSYTVALLETFFRSMRDHQSSRHNASLAKVALNHGGPAQAGTASLAINPRACR